MPHIQRHTSQTSRKKSVFEHVFSFITKFEVDFMQSQKGNEIHLLIEKKENPTLKSYSLLSEKQKPLITETRY